MRDHCRKLLQIADTRSQGGLGPFFGPAKLWKSSRVQCALKTRCMKQIHFVQFVARDLKKQIRMLRLLGKLARTAAPVARVSAAMSSLSRPLQVQAMKPLPQTARLLNPITVSAASATAVAPAVEPFCMDRFFSASVTAASEEGTGYDLSIAERMKMAEQIKRPKPTTPGKRHLVKLDRSDLWPGRYVSPPSALTHTHARTCRPLFPRAPLHSLPPLCFLHSAPSCP
jgi:hypothetical protein